MRGRVSNKRVLALTMVLIFWGALWLVLPASSVQPRELCSHSSDAVGQLEVPYPPENGTSGSLWNRTELVWYQFAPGEDSYDSLDWSQPFRRFHNAFVWRDGSFALLGSEQQKNYTYYSAGACDPLGLSKGLQDFANAAEVLPIAVTAYTQWSDNFFHKTIEVLPRLAPLATTGLLETGTFPLLMEAGLSTEYWLGMLGLPLSKQGEPGVVVRQIPENGLLVQELWVPPRSFCGAAVSGGMLRLFSRLVQRGAELDCSGFKRRPVFVRRKSYRALDKASDKALLTLLTKLAGKPFVFEPGQSLRETRCGFFQANLVVAPHGAALANLVFSRPGTAVIEIYPAMVKDSGPFGWRGGCWCYLDISMALGLRYRGIYATNGTQDSKLSLCDAQFDQVAAAIKSVLAH